MEVILIGTSHHTAPVGLRERVAFSAEQAREAVSQLRNRGILKEALILSTCNRSELYGVPAGGPTECAAAAESFLGSFHQLTEKELTGALYRRRGWDVARHIFRVAAGLDSMMLGEAEILGQVREAYRAALSGGATGRVLNRVFQDALAVGKRVRTETRLGALPMSVALASVRLAEQVFSGFDRRRALVMGAGATSEQVTRHLFDRGNPDVRVANRTIQNALGLAARFGVDAVPWENLSAVLEWPDLVITSVSAPEPILTQEMLRQTMRARGNQTLMIIDLGVPRNVATGASVLNNLRLFNIDDLTEIVEQNKRARQEEVPHAEAIVEEQLENFRRWHAWGNQQSPRAEDRAIPAAEAVTAWRERLAASSTGSMTEILQVSLQADN